MSSVFSGTNQGTFISTGASQILQIRSDVDYMWVYNLTVGAASQTTAVAAKFYWQRGFPTGAMWRTMKSNAANAANLEQYVTAGGFTLINNTINTPGPSVALTAISGAATPPVVSTGSTANLANGSVVRIFNTVGAQQLGGLDFTIGGLVANTSFTLAYMSAIVAGTTGTYRIIPYDPYFYPPTRVIANITPGPSASPALASSVSVVTLTVTHNFTVGQVIRFVIPTVTPLAYGTTQLNGVAATIVAINQPDANGFTNTITVNVDTTAFGAFAWPLTADPVHTPAQVVPVGENSAQAILSGSNFIGDSEVNLGYLGILLTGGAPSPAGLSGDVIYWVAGKSFSGGA
jgi:hypothetical protein